MSDSEYEYEFEEEGTGDTVPSPSTLKKGKSKSTPVKSKRKFKEEALARVKENLRKGREKRLENIKKAKEAQPKKLTAKERLEQAESEVKALKETIGKFRKPKAKEKPVKKVKKIIYESESDEEEEGTVSPVPSPPTLKKGKSKSKPIPVDNGLDALMRLF